jgi:hypothetical protein
MGRPNSRSVRHQSVQPKLLSTYHCRRGQCLHSVHIAGAGYISRGRRSASVGIQSLSLAPILALQAVLHVLLQAPRGVDVQLHVIRVHLHAVRFPLVPELLRIDLVQPHDGGQLTQHVGLEIGVGGGEYLLQLGVCGLGHGEVWAAQRAEGRCQVYSTTGAIPG